MFTLQRLLIAGLYAGDVVRLFLSTYEQRSKMSLLLESNASTAFDALRALRMIQLTPQAINAIQTGNNDKFKNIGAEMLGHLSILLLETAYYIRALFYDSSIEAQHLLALTIASLSVFTWYRGIYNEDRHEQGLAHRHQP